jgi:hypothetical protein
MASGITLCSHQGTMLFAGWEAVVKLLVMLLMTATLLKIADYVVTISRLIGDLRR